jgi:hypothetical protein
VPVTQISEQKMKAEGIRAYRADGKRVDAKMLPKLLAKQRGVLMSADGKKVDPFYLQIMKADTLVFVLPQPEGRPVPRPQPVPEIKPPERKPAR